MPFKVVQAMRNSGKLCIWEGDITLPDCGLAEEQLAIIHGKVSIFIHAASSINLKKSLPKIAPLIIHPSLMIANIALWCQNLDRFVYVSTAYASTFLHKTADGTLKGSDAVIKEDINHIDNEACTSAKQELFCLETIGTTPEYELVNHPFAYTYAKHLTERLLMELFDEHQVGHALMIFRPSCISPAESKPYPYYEMMGSAPSTMFFASILMSSPLSDVNYSTYLDGSNPPTTDEIPVDIVVNRLICHVAFETSGCVHAVNGIDNYPSIQEVWETVTRFRRWWWGRPKLIWLEEDWHSDKISEAARLFVILGCSFRFEDDKTKSIYGRMSEEQRSKWPLRRTREETVMSMVHGRRKMLRAVVRDTMQKLYGVPPVFTRALHKL